MRVATNLLRDKDIILTVTKEVLRNDFDFDRDKITLYEDKFEDALKDHMLAMIRKYEAEIDEQGNHKVNRSSCEAI